MKNAKMLAQPTHVQQKRKEIKISNPGSITLK